MTGLSYSTDQDTFGGPQGRRDGQGGQTARVIRAVAQGIADGVLIADQRLPSIRAMADEHGVSRDTVQRAYDKLVAGGQIYARRGSGFYVSSPPVLPTVPAIKVAPVDLAPFQLIHSSHPLDRSPGSGVLRHEPSAVEELNRVLKSVASSALRTTGYGDPAGYLPLREQLRNKLGIDGVDVPVDAILTVPGSIAGLGVVIRAFVRPGGRIVVEDPCSFAHVAALLSQGAEILHVPRKADGPDLDVLRLLCERYRPAMFLMSSLIQNPTGSCISLHKARQLIDIATEFEMILVDDVGQADLLPPAGNRPVAPLLLLDHLDHVIHVGGSSRILAPEVGVGYIVAGERYGDMLRRFRPLQGLGNMLIQERVLYRFLDEGLYRRRCERIRGQLAKETIALRQQFARMGIAAAPSMGGLFLWADLGNSIDTLDLAKRLLARGFLTAPGKHFRPAGMTSSEMRFNVTTTSEAALQALAESLPPIRD